MHVRALLVAHARLGVGMVPLARSVFAGRGAERMGLCAPDGLGRELSASARALGRALEGARVLVWARR